MECTEASCVVRCGQLNTMVVAKEEKNLATFQGRITFGSEFEDEQSRTSFSAFNLSVEGL